MFKNHRMTIAHRIAIVLDGSDVETVLGNIKHYESKVEIPHFSSSRQDNLRFTSEDDIFHTDEFAKWTAKLAKLDISYSSGSAKRDSVFDLYTSSGLHLYMTPLAGKLDKDGAGALAEEIFRDLGLDVSGLKYILTPTGISVRVDVDDLTAQQWLSTMYSTFTNMSLSSRIDEFVFHLGEEASLTFTSFAYPGGSSVPFTPGVKREVGVFEKDGRASSVDHFSVNGVRYTADDAKKTMLMFQRPHRLVPGLKFSTTLANIPSLHPVLKLDISGLFQEPMRFVDDVGEPRSMCELFYHVDMPNVVFWDRYQLLWHDETAKLIGLWGDTNLENPQYAGNEGYGSDALFRLNASSVEIPLHTRYLMPGPNSSVLTELPHGDLFWACDLKIPLNYVASKEVHTPIEHEQKQAKLDMFQKEINVLSQSPFEVSPFGYESYFERETVFYHIANANSATSLTVPVSYEADYAGVRVATFLLVLMSSLYLLRKCVLTRNSETRLN